jgi:hypothetical protein
MLVSSFSNNGSTNSKRYLSYRLGASSSNWRVSLLQTEKQTRKISLLAYKFYNKRFFDLLDSANEIRW